MISTLKHEKYEIDPHLGISVMLNEVWHRGICIIRGCIRLHSAVFVGKKVRIRDKRKLKIEQGSTIDDFVVLDALSLNGLRIKKNVKIGQYTQIRCSGSLKELGQGFEIGNNSGVGEFSFFGAAGGIRIGDNVIMGQNVRMHAENHYYNDEGKLIRLQGVNHKGIIVGNNCWIGSGVVILDGVTIGEGCVVGANSLVTHNLPNNSVAVGSPAKVIKSRLE